jgi:LuxR family transcriptional regulator, maltose regulon positive regulatory protein
VQILATKLHAPSRRAALVPRPSLIERLNKGLSRRLTLISAPAGFGKTTLAGEWIAACGRPSAWLSLEEGDSDFARFLVYIVAALRTIAPTIGTGIMAALETSKMSAAEPILASLLNEMESIPDDFILVLDDLHAIDAAAVDDALAFILEHQPTRMHLVIVTREDPDLPLARLRARGQLTELRASDLRFTADEASGFFNQTMGLNLPAGSVAALEARTEGWIAGLQMAALSLQGRQDIDGFIQSFTGSHRFVLDYLLEEVLQRQTDRVRGFLLQTALLDSMCGALCDAVTGREDGTEMLDALERGNLFVVPLDDHRQWYRYHHLFAEVLRAHAAAAEPGVIQDLHRRASAWHERNGRQPDAIRHALAAGDHERAAGLIEMAAPAMEGTLQAPQWQGWVRALPDQQVRARPVLSTWYAFVLMGSGDMEAAESRLSDAERWLAHPAAGMVIPDEQQYRALPSIIAVARAYVAQALGDAEGTMRHARRALELLPETEVVRRQQATGLLGITCWARGDLEAAAVVFAEYNRKLRSIGNLPDAIGTAYVLADIRAAQGRLREAVRTLEQMLQFTEEQGGPLPPETADLYRELSELFIEQGELEAAGRCLEKIEDLGGRTVLLSWTHRLRVAQALIRQARGDLDGALARLDEAERVFVRTPLPVVRPLAARRARIWIEQGRLEEARGWVRERGLSADDEPSFLREYEHLTLARVLMARGGGDARPSRRQAARLLERLLQAAGDGGRTGSMIEIMLLQARLLDADGDAPRALETLDRAVALAEPEGFVRLFADGGPSLAGMLERMASAHGGGAVPRGAFLRKVLAAIERRSAAQAVTVRPPPSLRGGGAAVVAPLLSARELEVLRLLAGELKGPEIARELYISLNTLRTHTKTIFGKLEVNTRLAAVRRARQLNLL